MQTVRMEFAFSINSFFPHAISKITSDDMKIRYVTISSTNPPLSKIQRRFLISHRPIPSLNFYPCIVLRIFFLRVTANRTEPCLQRAIDDIGRASQIAQNLRRAVTSTTSFIGSNQVLYIMTNPSENR